LRVRRVANGKLEPLGAGVEPARRMSMASGSSFFAEGYDNADRRNLT